MDALKGVAEVFDEVCAAACVIAGIVFIFKTGNFQAGMAILNAGGMYLFGKHQPQR